MEQDNPSPQVVLQRVRNRIIEVLDVLASLEEQQRFISGPNELINQWEDWVHGSLDAYSAPVFSREEQGALRAFHTIWNAVADSTPNPLPNWDQTQRLPGWEVLRVEAERTLAVFMKRGRLSEDVELES
jgi:hypothetical protein